MRRVSSRMIAALALGCLALVMSGAIGQTGQARQTRQTTPGGNPEAKSLKNPVEATAKSIATGQELYRKYCRHCHGATGKGDGPLAPEGSHPSNLTDDVWDHGSSDGEIFGVIRRGIPNSEMKALSSKLTPQQMWAIVNYIRSLGTQPKSR